ncbi:MAG TPA: CehA/McbA family metallohydrolase [Planctomycetota bacterium]|nr:CehA/McbA family metallohydrolase [Planctomycetota bacterium]
MMHWACFAGLAFVLLACSAASAERPQGRLEVTITEAGGGHLPCRVHLMAEGKPVYAPGLPRFERDPHFCCPGQFAVDVPVGKVSLRIERGPEYVPFTTELTVNDGQAVQLPVQLARWIDMNERGWYSGDLHVHRPVADMPLLLRADDLNLAPVLTHWNRSHVAVRQPYLVEVADDGAASPKPRCFHTLAQEDERAGGAILLFNLAQPIVIEGVTRDCPSGFAYHERAIEQKAVIEVEKPFWWEAPVHVALGRVDTIGIACNHFHRAGLLEGEAWGRPRDRARYPAGPLGFALNVLDLYYRYLNLGYQIPASAGSASGVLANPLGYNRAYVQLDRFAYDAWFEGLRQGRNFVTNGPMLFAKVNGKLAGARFEVAQGAKFEGALELEVLGRDPLEKAEVVVGGEVVATFRPAPDEPRRIAARHTLSLERSTWIGVRAFEPVRGAVIRFAHTSPFYVTVGGEKPRDREAAQFYVRWLDELIAATEKKQAAAKDPKPFEPVLATYRRARAVYAAAAAP